MLFCTHYLSLQESLPTLTSSMSFSPNIVASSTAKDPNSIDLTVGDVPPVEVLASKAKRPDPQEAEERQQPAVNTGIASTLSNEDDVAMLPVPAEIDFETASLEEIRNYLKVPDMQAVGRLSSAELTTLLTTLGDGGFLKNESVASKAKRPDPQEAEERQQPAVNTGIASTLSNEDDVAMLPVPAEIDFETASLEEIRNYLKVPDMQAVGRLSSAELTTLLTTLGDGGFLKNESAVSRGIDRIF